MRKNKKQVALFKLCRSIQLEEEKRWDEDDKGRGRRNKSFNSFLN